MRASLDQLRARHAWKAVGDLSTKSEAYRARAAELPLFIRMAGLGQVAAFYRAKSSGPDRNKQESESYQTFYAILAEWLCSPGMPFTGVPDLLEATMRATAVQYRWGEEEAQAYALWLARVARVLLPTRGTAGAGERKDGVEQA